MKLTINRIEMTNFRGFRHKEVVFDGNTRVLGANAQGKTSLYFAWMWLMSGKSDALTSDPNVTPMGMPECETIVEAEITIDGRPCTIAKFQKYKEKTDDSGKTISSVTNKYTVNGVDKSATTFVSDMKERGIDMDNFLILSHVFAFTSDTSKKGREVMRKVLFEMVDGITDLDIAQEMKSNDLIALLEKGYKIDEIEQMNRSSLKSLNSRYGANNELIESRIQGIYDSKANVDVKSLEKQKADYESELEQVRSDFYNLRNADNDIKEKIARLEGECIDLESKCQRETDSKIDSASEKLRKYEAKRHEAEIKEINAKAEADRILAEKTGIKESLDTYRELYKKVQNEVFDESSTVCPSCKRPFDKSEIDRIRKDFEDGKAKRLADYKSKGETFAKKYADLDNEIFVVSAEHDKANSEWKKADAKVDKYAEELRVIPRRPNMNENEEYINLREQIQALKDSLGQTDAFKIQELSNRESYLIQVIKQTVGEIALAERNKELDKQIEDLRQEKKDAEIKRAEHERIINEVEKFKKVRNDKLSDIVNSHFNIAQFRLFKVLKNGTIEDDCSILVSGKELNSQLNQSTQILALTDVIAGLQSFKEQYLPVFLDNHALFTAETDKKIPLKCQTIKLIASEGVEGLVIEHE